MDAGNSLKVWCYHPLTNIRGVIFHSIVLLMFRYLVKFINDTRSNHLDALNM